jgi:pyruvate dehydrogenase E1 component alpha subunit|tara:strand:+ start:510 stop:1151 length:642 start_codon:yes stop_codon:yes gene_type:complete
MATPWTKKRLIDFEEKIKERWNNAEIPYYIHLSGGNEEQLIELFKEINPQDYKISTHRSHYHYLLSGGSEEKLEKMILDGRSMHIMDKDLNFISTAIVSGGPAMATGIALGLKKQGENRGPGNRKVWCFLGDAAEDEGHFYEAVRYVDGHNLPCTFVIEDNNRSVETPKIERYGTSEIQWPSCVRRYNYVPTTPHAGTGKFVDFSGTKLGSTM